MKKIINKSFLSFSFSKGFMSPNIPIATFYQDGKELNFIIDTGSDDNVISKEALGGIKYEKLLREWSEQCIKTLEEIKNENTDN